MKPIINPWLFYLADVSSSIKDACIVTSVIIGVTILIYLIFIVALKCDDYDTEVKWHWKNVKTFIIVFIITLFGALSVPSQRTCYTIITASMITPDNISTAGNTALDVIDYIVESILEIKESE